MLLSCGKAEKPKITNIDDLNNHNYRIILNVGSAAADDAYKRFPEAQKVYTHDIDSGYKEVLERKSDAYVYGKLYMEYAIQAKKYQDLTIMNEVLNKTDVVVGVAPKRSDILPKINSFIRKIKLDGTLEDMYNRWIIDGKEEMPDIPVPKSPDIKLRIGTSGAVQPMNYINTNNQLTGFDIEFIKRLANYLNAEITIRELNFDMLIASLETCDLDAVVSDLNATADRQIGILMSEPYMISESAVLVRKDSLSNYSVSDNSKPIANDGFFGGIAKSINRTFVIEDRWKTILNGLSVTLIISLSSLLLGTMLGFVGSFALMSKKTKVRQVASAVSTFLEGMPIILTLLILYYSVFKGADISPVIIAIIGFSIDFANIVAQIIKTGVLGVSRGEIEAAKSMGYDRKQTFLKIIFPQAVGQMHGQYQSCIVGLVKGTAVAGYITVVDLTKAIDIIRSSTYEAFFPLITTAILYFAIAHFLVEISALFISKIIPDRRIRRIKGVKIND